MQSDVLVIPKFPILPVHDLTVTFLYDPDEIFGFYNWVTSGKHSGWGIGARHRPEELMGPEELVKQLSCAGCTPGN